MCLIAENRTIANIIKQFVIFNKKAVHLWSLFLFLAVKTQIKKIVAILKDDFENGCSPKIEHLNMDTVKYWILLHVVCKIEPKKITGTMLP